MARRVPTAQCAGSFVVSAPGKVILFGEHAVVYGKPAIAAAISLRSFIVVEPESVRSGCINLQLPDIDLNCTWQIEDLPWSFAEKVRSEAELAGIVSEVTEYDLSARLATVAENALPDAPFEVFSTQKKAAVAFLYVLLSLGTASKVSGSRYVLVSNLPVGSGLGSSSSMSVCFATALLHQLGHITISTQSVEYAERARKLIQKYALLSEACIHGTTSGVDVAVSVLGGALMYRKGKPSDSSSLVMSIRHCPTMDLVITHTGQAKDTALQVSKVHALRVTDRKRVDVILSTIAHITLEGYRHISNARWFENLQDDITSRLGPLITANQELLSELDVSHPRIDDVCEHFSKASGGYSKLTGAGGGGCVLTLISDKTKASGAIKALQDRGFVVLPAKMGQPGVKIATLNHRSQFGIDVLSPANALRESDDMLEGRAISWKTL